MTRTQRLFQLMQALRSLPAPVTAELLASELDVGPRTIYRDIETLRGMGAVIDGAAGYGYTMIEDHALPPMGFENDELEALVLGLREVQEIGDPALAKAAGQALTKLQARLPAKQAHRLRHAVLAVHRFHDMPVPTIDVRTLRQATWDEMRIRFDYRDAKGTPSAREVDPLSIVYFDQSHCLLAYCHLRQDYRAFRLDRMGVLDVLEHSFRPRRVTMLREYKERLKAEALERGWRKVSDTQ